jgi:hypothetical protein
MSTAASSAATAPKTAGSAGSDTFVTDTAKQATEQIIAAVRQTTKVGLDAASTWIDTLTAALPAVPAVPGTPSKAVVEQWVSLGFDAAENVLSLQREIASDLVTKLLPAGR